MAGDRGCRPHLPVRLTAHQLDVLHRAGLARVGAEPRPQEVCQDVAGLSCAVGDVKSDLGEVAGVNDAVGQPT